MSLNQEQYRAATAPLGHNLIIASAGTGKTSTIVGRIGHLLNSGIKAHEILLLTFTNKAAAEMIERVAKLFDLKTAKAIEAGTFHAVSYRLLKKRYENLSLKQPKELKVLLKTIHANRNFSFIDCDESPYASNTLYDLYSLFVNSNPSISFSEWISQNYPHHENYSLIYEDILNEFNEEKRRFGYIDFNDLLVYMKKELQEHKNEDFVEILVDEYQDTNTLQGSLIDAFKSKSLFCVGDYDQSIYAFNGANIHNIGSFSLRYPDANIFTLKKNYRSSSYILDLANRVISQNPRLYPKELEVTREGKFDPPQLLIYDELFIQYRSIANSIKEKIISNKIKAENIAVIFRNNSSADGVEATLREQGIKSKRKGSISFFETREIKTILEMFSVMLNPKDMMAFIHIFEYAPGIGPVVARELFDGLYTLGNGNILSGLLKPDQSINNPFKKRKLCQELGLFDINYETGSILKFTSLGFDETFQANPILRHAKLSVEGAKYLWNFYLLLKHAHRHKTPQSLLNFIAKSKAYEYIKLRLATQRATKKDGSVDENAKIDAIENIEKKLNMLENLTHNYTSCEKFLNSLTLGSSEMSEGSGVNLLSVHASKGLEFEEVYVIDLMDTRFPNHKLMNTGGGIEEERRLFYVATTRAKDRLFLSFAKYDANKKITYKPSIFLNESGFTGLEDGTF